MALYGRGQPHPPILLRNVVVAAIVAATAAPQIHVVLQDRLGRPSTAKVLQLRGRALVPDRLPRQITIVSAAAGLPAARAPRGTDVRILRAPAAAPVVPFVRPLLVVLGQAAERTGPIGLRGGHVLTLRTALAPATVAAPGPQITTVSLVASRRPIVRRTAIVFVRPSRNALVPPRLPVQVHVISQVGDRARVRREPILLQLRTGVEQPVGGAPGRPPYGVIVSGSPTASVSGAPDIQLGTAGGDATVGRAPDATVSTPWGVTLT